jgi:hypothetical protein
MSEGSKFGTNGLLEQNSSCDLLSLGNMPCPSLSAGTLTAEEDHELQQFQQAELLMRLVKARLRERNGG